MKVGSMMRKKSSGMRKSIIGNTGGLTAKCPIMSGEETPGGMMTPKRVREREIGTMTEDRGNQR